MLWRRCCRGLSVWSRVLLALGKPSPLPLSFTTSPVKATGERDMLKNEPSSHLYYINIACPLITVCGLCVLADRYWCVLPATSPLTSWLRRFTRLVWRSWGCVQRAERPSSHRCHSWLCITRLATWTGQWDPERQLIHYWHMIADKYPPWCITQNFVCVISVSVFISALLTIVWTVMMSSYYCFCPRKQLKIYCWDKWN